MEGGYNLRNPAVKRLMREAQELKDKTEQFSAYPLEDNLFEWHFTIRGPADTEFENGLYHGRIILPPEYPMKPPSIILLTPSGRFETNRKICLSISGFHPESWQPSWSLRTALLGIIGFMPTHGNGAIGSLDYTPEERKVLAKKSQDWKCPQCGLINDLVLPITELSQELAKEAKEIGQQLNMQGEKTKSTPEENGVPKSATVDDVASDGVGSATLPSASGPASSAAPTIAPQPSMPTTSPPFFMGFQRPQVPGMSQNNLFPYSLPPMPLFVPPSFPLHFPGVPPNSATPGPTQQSSTNQAPIPINPYFPPPIFLPNFMFNPNFQSFQNHALSSVPISSFPSANEAFAWPLRATNAVPQATFLHTSTVTVSSPTTLIASPAPTSNTGARPKVPTSIQQSSPSSSDSCPSAAKKSSSSSLQQPPSAEKPLHQPNLADLPNSSSKSEIARPGSAEKCEMGEKSRPSAAAQSTTMSSSDDGDPVPLASNLRHRVRSSTSAGQTNQSRINRTNMPAEPPVTNRPRYATRAGIMEAMADMLVIILLFCIFGLLARRASMFL